MPTTTIGSNSSSSSKDGDDGPSSDPLLPLIVAARATTESTSLDHDHDRLFSMRVAAESKEEEGKRGDNVAGAAAAAFLSGLQLLAADPAGEASLVDDAARHNANESSAAASTEAASAAAAPPSVGPTAAAAAAPGSSLHMEISNAVTDPTRFPRRLHSMLTEIEEHSAAGGISSNNKEDDFDQYVSWAPHGRCKFLFCVCNKERKSTKERKMEPYREPFVCLDSVLMSFVLCFFCYATGFLIKNRKAFTEQVMPK